MVDAKISRWAVYIKERFPIFVYVLLSFGLASSTILISKPRLGNIEVSLPIALATFGFLIFFIILRLMDELKDFEKDKIAHPERPLPQGLFTTQEFSTYINRMNALMFAFAFYCGTFMNPLVGICYSAVTIFVWLMYKEFYIGQQLALHPFTYAVTHQIVMFPLIFFGVSLVNTHLILSFSTLCLGLNFMGAFFTYEILRKLDPQANPLLKTYLSVHGPRRTCLLALLTLACSAIGVCGLIQLGFHFFEWLFWLQGIVTLSLTLIIFSPKSYKWVERLAEINLLTHLWIVPIIGWRFGL